MSFRVPLNKCVCGVRLSLSSSCDGFICFGSCLMFLGF
ncbi:unnamed protein product [Brassica oleracea var. botrytis]